MLNCVCPSHFELVFIQFQCEFLLYSLALETKVMADHSSLLDAELLLPEDFHLDFKFPIPDHLDLEGRCKHIDKRVAEALVYFKLNFFDVFFDVILLVLQFEVANPFVSIIQLTFFLFLNQLVCVPVLKRNFHYFIFQQLHLLQLHFLLLELFRETIYNLLL